ncbi:MAG: CoB--CoM heterodisulfide reductase iron-sulfur subunit A family protein, partial [Pirellulales bacterium]|nr:CoB--CoM heterodisulfide reductase iron-sulfur subunit A family protein [Pirellulales bacterium]
GFSVALLEQSPSLGGQIMQWARLYPTGKRGNELALSLIAEVNNDPNIDVYTNTKVQEVSGYVGDFHLTARQTVDGVDEKPVSIDIKLRSGAIVLATGFELYEPKTGEFGYGEIPEVITLAQLEHLLAEDQTTNSALRYNGRQIRNVCLVHCVGSRQIEGIHEPGANGRINDYCSRVCCTASLQAAADIRERFPAVNIFDLYRDIRTYGRNHELYYEEATRQGVTFLRYEPEDMPLVSKPDGGNDYPLRVTVRDKLTFDEEVEIPADLVVLATAMVPRNLDNLIDQLKLSRSADGFLQEVHPKLQPVEMAVGGVFLAGTCQAPMDISESCAGASAAAAKVAALLGKGHIEMDPFRAKIDINLCQGEGKCVDVCEYQKAITLVDAGTKGNGPKRAEVNSLLCNGCGMCVAVCPHQAIQVAGWQMNQFDAMVDALVQEYA